MTHTYAWGNNEERATLKGRGCQVVARGRMRSVLVEFENGERVLTSERALRWSDESDEVIAAQGRVVVAQIQRG